MFTLYRHIKTAFTVGLIGSLAWFTAHSIAQESSDAEVPPAVEELKIKPKMLSEMTAAEKAKLSKEELQKLKKLEEELKKLEKPEY